MQSGYFPRSPASHCRPGPPTPKRVPYSIATMAAQVSFQLGAEWIPGDGAVCSAWAVKSERETWSLPGEGHGLTLLQDGGLLGELVEGRAWWIRVKKLGTEEAMLGPFRVRVRHSDSPPALPSSVNLLLTTGRNSFCVQVQAFSSTPAQTVMCHEGTGSHTCRSCL